jgi:hypothetical protein
VAERILHAAQHGAHDDRPSRALAHAVAVPAIDLLVSLALDLFGGAGEAVDWEPITLRREEAVHSQESIAHPLEYGLAEVS